MLEARAECALPRAEPLGPSAPLDVVGLLSRAVLSVPSRPAPLGESTLEQHHRQMPPEPHQNVTRSRELDLHHTFH